MLDERPVQVEPLTMFKEDLEESDVSAVMVRLVLAMIQPLLEAMRSTQLVSITSIIPSASLTGCGVALRGCTKLSF